MNRELILPLIVVSLLPSTTLAAPAGPARAEIAGDILTLENDALAVTWSVGAGRLQPLAMRDKLSNRTIEAIGEAFIVTLSDGRSIRASQLELADAPQIRSLPGHPDSPRLADRLAGQMVTARFQSVDNGPRIQWQAVLRDDTHYVRQSLTLRISREAPPLETITLVDLDCRDARVIGTVAGSPVVASGMFFAYEHPNSESIVRTADAFGGPPTCLLYTSPSPRDRTRSRMPSSA